MKKSIRNLSAVTTVGLDIAKNVFQVHGVDAAGFVVVAKSVRRAQLLAFFASAPPCLVGIEACSSAHHWARSLIAIGHRVKLIPPAYVRPYVRRNKNDAVDAEAICEAVGRPNMRFVAVRAVENQAELMRHRTRELLAGNRTRMLNALRGHLAEIGVVAPQGAQHAYGLKRLLTAGHDDNGEILVPACVREALAPLAGQIDAIDAEIEAIDGQIKAQVKGDDLARRWTRAPLPAAGSSRPSSA
jgi:transposase